MELMNSDSENSQGSGNTQPGARLYMRLVRRLTRFVSKATFEKTVTVLSQTFTDLQYSVKKCGQGQFILTLNDKKRHALVFKATVSQLDKDQVLVDFRLAKVCVDCFIILFMRFLLLIYLFMTQGDRIEFKRQFLTIKNRLTPIIQSYGSNLLKSSNGAPLF